MIRVALIETGAANVFNIESALVRLGFAVQRVRDADGLVDFDRIVFPGVANFGFVCETLRSRGLDVALRAAIASGFPYLGICVGMQLLYERSEETPGAAGLGILAGTVRRLHGPKIPQMGWNYVTSRQPEPAFADGWAYFANSYAVDAAAESVTAISEYEGAFGAACQLGNVAGLQFHPERSGTYGLSVLERLLALESALHAR